AMNIALEAGAGALGELPAEWRDAKPPRSLLLFTDGVPDIPASALAAGQRCREQQIQLVAIGTGDADTAFLSQLTGDARLVFHCETGGFDEAFKEAEKVIGGGSLVESSTSQQGL